MPQKPYNWFDWLCAGLLCLFLAFILTLMCCGLIPDH